jgi:thioredoxin reductase/pSer/pThr/pTyr-binding forkhead associated (FHA) protein/ferredoxin
MSNAPNATSQLIDMLIVGGGPAGTAAAFRAKELGIRALVIDFDDLMKRIRDYSKDKLILPNFGGGDKMKFPAGGELVSRLHFSDIDKDEMCQTWKRYYVECDIPARVGPELTGLERNADGTWTANTWNHVTNAAEVYHTRYVVLAPGRGVPRRFDIPGNTEGIAYRLDDANNYIEGPVCVIGGGTSAAEAVIAISNAKVAANDPFPVAWSYRGTQMPRVSKALAGTFFEAYLGNGNVRYYPVSEPVAVVHGPDRVEYLSVLVDRKSVPGRIQECMHLEFPKTRCIACIGEDIPEAFLRDLGIHMVAGGAGEKKMMAVSPLLETQQPGVFLIGDLLSQAYFETERFDADPGTFQRIKHRGNIKSSLRDGVFVAEVIKQKLEGRTRIDVVMRDADDAPAAVPVSSPAAPKSPFGSTAKVPAASEAAESLVNTGHSTVAVDQSLLEPVTDAHLVSVTEAGVDADEFPLRVVGVTRIGSADCDVNFPGDPHVAVNHASITNRDGAYYLRDDGSTSGTFLRLRVGNPRQLASGDLLRLGRQILVLQHDLRGYTVQQYDVRGSLVASHELPERTVVFGRAGERGDPDVVLATDDMTLSRFHVAITRKGDTMLVEDFNSRNGTFLKVGDSAKLFQGDEIRLGRQILRVVLKAEAPDKTGSAPSKEFPRPVAAIPVEPAPAPAGKVAQVTFKATGGTFAMQASQTILDIADEFDVELDHECWVGKCGADLIRIVEGQEFCNEVSEQEAKTIKRRGAVPGQCRLACMTRVSGPVVVEAAD